MCIACRLYQSAYDTVKRYNDSADNDATLTRRVVDVGTTLAEEWRVAAGKEGFVIPDAVKAEVTSFIRPNAASAVASARHGRKKNRSSANTDNTNVNNTARLFLGVQQPSWMQGQEGGGAAQATATPATTTPGTATPAIVTPAPFGYGKLSGQPAAVPAPYGYGPITSNTSATTFSSSRSSQS